MKIVFSRKGFDAGTGGCPSPIGPSGEMISLPIPGGQGCPQFGHIQSPLGSVGDLVSDLSRQKLSHSDRAHHDPDLWAEARPRLPGWRPNLGQTGRAQSHLTTQGVTEGDLLLFFGWFRAIEKQDKGWSYVRGAPAHHVLFGYLQIGESLVLGSTPDPKDLHASYAFLHDHPHLHGERSSNNTIHLASDELVLAGKRTGLPGGGVFPSYQEALVLSADKTRHKSLWRLPAWAAPRPGRPPLSYHASSERWSQDEASDTVLVQTVAKGQEFVLDIQEESEPLTWVETVIRNGVQGPLPNSSRRRFKS